MKVWFSMLSFTVILFFSLVLMVALESVTIKWVHSMQTKSPPSEQLVILVELVKGFACGVIYLVKSFKRGTDGEYVPSSSIMWFVVPASLYAVSNNVTFAALSRLSPPMFNLLMNLKIPLTGILAAGFLGYVINRLLGASFVMLFVGSAIACVTWDNGLVLDADGFGVFLMIIYATCSASAAVYTEYVTKLRFGSENMFLQNIKFCTCGLLLNLALVIFKGDLRCIFHDVEKVHWASIFALSMNGLVTAAVLKYAGSIVKTYAVSVAMFVAALFTYMIWRTILSWNFYVGGFICAAAVHMYVKGKNDIRVAPPFNPGEDQQLLDE